MIYGDGKVLNLWVELQANLLIRTSLEVVEKARMFEIILVLYEVPFLSTWQMHFYEYSVTKNSISLFFSFFFLCQRS